MDTNPETVLVTGASGFIAGHCIVKLLNEGYAVRGSLRTASRAEEVRAAIANHADTSRLSFVTLDLTSDAGWDDAIAGCTYLQHVASPFPAAEPKHEDDLIVPARDGALRALKAAARAGVKRSVMTSSIAAIAYGTDNDQDHIYTEDDWSDCDGGIGAYAKSKTIAEREAWNFMKTPGAGAMELAVINPGAVMGPLLAADYSTSGDIVKKLMDGSIPACPQIGFACIDVRDVADAHYEAMIRPGAAGRRYALVESFHWMSDVSKALRAAGYNTPAKSLPNFVVRLLAFVDPTARLFKGLLGRQTNIGNQRLRSELGIAPRPLADMAVSMAKTMTEFGVVSPKML